MSFCIVEEGPNYVVKDLQGKVITKVLSELLKSNVAIVNELVAAKEAGKSLDEVKRILNKITKSASPQTRQTSSFGNYNFLGYKGGYQNTGKGTSRGDGKDIAMREVANGGFIGEIVDLNAESSTKMSFLTVKIWDTNPAYQQIYERETGNLSGGMFGMGLDFKKDKNGKILTLDEVVKAPIRANNVTATRINVAKPNRTYKVMLARNGEFKNEELAFVTKEKILKAHNEGATFVVGDMPGVDTQFIDYLKEIGATFTIYHTGNESRIKVNETSFAQQSSLEFISSEESILKSSEPSSLTPIQQLKYILTDYNLDFNSLPSTTQSEIERELTKNPDQLNNKEFIQAIKCLF